MSRTAAIPLIFVTIVTNCWSEMCDTQALTQARILDVTPRLCAQIFRHLGCCFTPITEEWPAAQFKSGIIKFFVPRFASTAP